MPPRQTPALNAQQRRQPGFRQFLYLEVGADRVELYTGPYAESFGTPSERNGRERCLASGRAAQEAGLGLNAGHDLNLENLPPLIKGMPWLEEVSIGHALTADALVLGYYEAVRAYLRVLSGAQRPHQVFYPTSEMDRMPVGAFKADVGFIVE